MAMSCRCTGMLIGSVVCERLCILDPLRWASCGAVNLSAGIIDNLVKGASGQPMQVLILVMGSM